MKNHMHNGVHVPTFLQKICRNDEIVDIAVDGCLHYDVQYK